MFAYIRASSLVGGKLAPDYKETVKGFYPLDRNYKGFGMLEFGKKYPKAVVKRIFESFEKVEQTAGWQTSNYDIMLAILIERVGSDIIPRKHVATWEATSRLRCKCKLIEGGKPLYMPKPLGDAPAGRTDLKGLF